MSNRSDRLANIGAVTAMIGEMIDNEEVVDFYKCVEKVMVSKGISYRTSIEYVMTAFARLNLKK